MAREKTIAKKQPEELQQAEPWNTYADFEKMVRNFFTSPWPMALMKPSEMMEEMRKHFKPEIDLKETNKEYIIEAILPGMTKEDININVTPDTICISGERKKQEETPEEKYHVRQQYYGSFKVTYALPTEVKPEGVKATYTDGVLQIKMPKVQDTQPRKVDVEIKGK